MQIVIDIPDTAYRGIIKADHAGGDWSNDLLGILCSGVANGTPLPKGHRGRGIKRTYDAKRFDGKCPYTGKPCYEWECDICEIEAEEKKSMEALDRAESEEADENHD